jgi:RHS repeat-associated protein
VNGVVNPSYAYDLNGNMSSGAGRTIGVTSYNMVGSITSATSAVCLAYDTEHTRIQQTVGIGSCPNPTSPSVTTYLNDPTSGVMSERFVSGATTTWHDFVRTDEKIVAERFCTGSAPCSSGASLRYFTLDHLGSVAVVTDATGLGDITHSERDSYDVWGKRRLITGNDDPSCALTSQTTRGYTNQEMIDSQCLINLNARLYDQTIGRLLTADPVTATPFEPQSLNRYSYSANRPLSYTDTSGLSWADITFWSDGRVDISAPIYFINQSSSPNAVRDAVANIEASG